MGDELVQLLDELVRREDCVLLPPAGPPAVQQGDLLPDDLRLFYERCGGGSVRTGHAYGLDLRPPRGLVPTNTVTVPLEELDISSHWYVVANGAGSTIDLVSIDLHPDRVGLCYDSFWDVHASPGNCAVVATSFTDLLRRALSSRDESWWWTEEAFEGLGDAYDGTEPAE